jgi:hypothetical protein
MAVPGVLLGVHFQFVFGPVNTFLSFALCHQVFLLLLSIPPCSDTYLGTPSRPRAGFLARTNTVVSLRLLSTDSRGTIEPFSTDDWLSTLLLDPAITSFPHSTARSLLRTSQSLQQAVGPCTYPTRPDQAIAEYGACAGNTLLLRLLRLLSIHVQPSLCHHCLYLGSLVLAAPVGVLLINLLLSLPDSSSSESTCQPHQTLT